MCSSCPTNRRNNFTQMDRIIENGDVIEYSSNIPHQKVNYSRSDHIVLDGKFLAQYSGTVVIRLVPPEEGDDDVPPQDLPVESSMRAKLHKRATENDDDETYDPYIVTNYFNAKANHKMTRTGQKRVARSKRSPRDLIDLSGLVESTLLTYVDKS